MFVCKVDILRCPALIQSYHPVQPVMPFALVLSNPTRKVQIVYLNFTYICREERWHKEAERSSVHQAW